MRVALISDLHGNTVAMEAALDGIADFGVDEIICLGDIAANGPDPSGAIDRLVDIGAMSVMGNTDAGMVEVPAWWHDPSSMGIPLDGHPGIEIGVWCAEQISSAERGYLAGLPLTVELELSSMRLLGFHGSPRSFDDLVTSTTPEPEIAEIVSGTSHELLAGGHTHVPMVRRIDGRTWINPGSVGLPFTGYGYAGSVSILPRASYAIIEALGSAVSIHLHEAPIDLIRLEREVRTSGMPNADWWLGRWAY